jgi:signal transduction histidine kinase
MLAAIAAVASLAYWDDERESAAALEDFAQEQATLARGVASNIESRLANVRHDGPVTDEDARNLASGATRIERPGTLLLLIRPPQSRSFHTTDGRAIDAPELAAAIDAGATSFRLRPPQAATLGLPQRTALAGLARVDAGALGVWGIATVATAERERDRERRARWRLVLAVAFAGGLVFAFGGAALRMQRKELVLERELALAEQARIGEDRLERASKAATLGTLAMGIAHEVSTPLGVISGRAEQLVAKVAGDERASRSVQTILEQSERIGQVIRAFLGLARGDSPPVHATHPRAIVEGAMALCEHRFEKAGINVTAEIPNDLPTVHGDQHLLEHALVNLLLNACDACQPGGHIQIGSQVVDGTIHITVDDDGAGIPAADAARALEPFFTTKAENGSGLGLAIANEIVKSHHGSLSLAPRVPRGTRASIELPLPNRETK